MNKRLYGMAPGGRMALDRVANRARSIRYFAKARTQQASKRTGRAREKKRGLEEGEGT